MQAEAEQMRAKAEQMQQMLRSAAAKVSSPDGVVTVTVGPSGVLQELKFDARAYRRPPEALSALVLRLIGEAQRKVSAQMTSALGALVGESSQAMELFKEFVPEDPEDPEVPVDELEDRPEEQPEKQPEKPLTPPVPPAPPMVPRQAVRRQPSAPVRRRPPVEEDDEDFQNPW